MVSELVSIGIELIGELAKLIMEAVAANDPSKLRKVTDVLPVGHALHARIVVAESKILAAKDLAEHG
jgi:hypothetical protein